LAQIPCIIRLGSIFHFPPQDSITGEAEDYSVAIDVQGQGQVVTVSGGSFSGSVKQIEVTVTGFAGDH